MRVTVLTRDALWCLDATYLRRAEQRSMWGEVVKDVATGDFLAVSVGAAASGKDVAALLACLAPNERARPSRGGSRARDLDRILPHRDSRPSRESFNRTAQEAIEQALAAAPSRRAQRSFVREASYKTLELFDLVKRTRGERPLPGPITEGER